MFIVLFFAVLTQAAAAERTFNILFIQSYTSQTPWHSDLNQGLAKGFKESGLKVNITTEYLCGFLGIQFREGNHASFLSACPRQADRFDCNCE